jgi:hypothetical protein
MSFLLWLLNPHRNEDPEKKETGPDSIKTISIPLEIFKVFPERRLLMNWYRMKGGRNHLANFSRKGLTDFFFVNVL